MTILIVISREVREDDDQVYCRLKLKEVNGTGYKSKTFPTAQAAKQAAEELMARTDPASTGSGGVKAN